ncbi:MAG: polyribonucleotide nucleotidyltransferase [Proteobacteria bacterium]|nr:polyribonucleotide nucleotidyltransferase [Pseudomonadota bacterium]
MAKTIVSTTINGTEFSFETGRVAKQAGGSVLVRMGESVVLVAATTAAKHGDRDFLPLTCEYRPMAYAAGRIPGGYFKREGRPGPKGILVARMMDRPHRPLFPKNWRAEIQLLAYPISHDIENNTDVLALTGASAATCISDIPFDGPLAGVRVGRVDGEWIANPTKTQLVGSDFDMIVASTEHAITMVEGGMHEASEADIIAGLEFGFQACQPLIQLQHELVKLVGKEKREIPAVADNSELFEQIAGSYTEATVATFEIAGKEERRLAQRAIREQIRADLALGSDDDDANETHRKLLGQMHEKLVKTTMRARVIESGVRLDGRATDEIRDISVEVGVLPRTHGSALFTRGETQALVTCTLGTRRDEQRIDELDEQGWNRFMLHYNFPSYSVGETRRIMGPGRREIGHGALAERAVRQTVPGEDYPYVVRIVSDITESNGSSSMASVCGASLAMMDASVPTSAPVAGIAMGLIKEGDAFSVLSDISGAEDHLGDMDFKVTGTAKGVTAFQMDTKIKGVSAEIMTKALAQAREGRTHILAEMNKVISEPRAELSAYAPRIVQITISQDRIRDIIGPGGKTIKGMQEATGATINVDDSGTVTVSAIDLDATDAAIKMIRELTQEAEIGKLYLGIVKKVVDFGAFVEIFTGTDGLVHISELAPGRVNKVTDVLDEGDEVLVKCIEVDKSGKIRLSRRAALGDAMGGGSVQAEA